MGGVTANLRRGRGAADRIAGAQVSHELLRVFGVSPILGRGFGPDDDKPGGANDVVLLTESLWRSRFGADAAIVGTSITLDERPRTVIGVVPDGIYTEPRRPVLRAGGARPGRSRPEGRTLGGGVRRA